MNPCICTQYETEAGHGHEVLSCHGEALTSRSVTLGSVCLRLRFEFGEAGPADGCSKDEILPVCQLVQKIRLDLMCRSMASMRTLASPWKACSYIQFCIPGYKLRISLSSATYRACLSLPRMTDRGRHSTITDTEMKLNYVSRKCTNRRQIQCQQACCKILDLLQLEHLMNTVVYLFTQMQNVN